MNRRAVVEIKNMSKRFGSTIALNNVDITVYAGEICGLIGENGSGKSTATSIYAGMQKCDSGEMFLEGKSWNPKSMMEALEQGVGMIVQENGTVSGVSVAENIFLGKSSLFKKGPFVNKKEMIKKAQEALDQIGAGHILAETMTSALDFQDRKLIEIAKVIVKEPKVLIVDETTTALSQLGRKIIYDLMNKMREEGKTVIFISHDLDEIMKVCSRLTVLRDGNIIRTFEKDEFEENAIKSSMIGREMKGDYYRSDYDGSCSEEVVAEIKDANFGNQLINFQLQLHKGEILGIGGLSHCGMHTLGKVMFGNLKLESGSVTVHGKVIKNEIQAMSENVGYVAKDRDVESLCLEASIKDNIAVAGLDKIAVSNFLILPNKEKQYVENQIETLSIKCADANQQVSALSGGNKQKVVFGKWIGRGSEILILDCPTRGVDIGVKQAMYQMMYQMKKEGKSILLISEEMAELIGMSDRVIVMKDGEQKMEFKRSETLSEADMIEYMI